MFVRNQYVYEITVFAENAVLSPAKVEMIVAMQQGHAQRVG